MRKRLLIAVFVASVLAALGLALDAYVNRPGRLCYRNYERIQVGTKRVTGDKFFRWQESAIGKKVIVAFDSDEAGRLGADRAADLLRKRGVQVNKAIPPVQFHDVGEMTIDDIAAWVNQMKESDAVNVEVFRVQSFF